MFRCRFEIPVDTDACIYVQADSCGQVELIVETIDTGKSALVSLNGEQVSKLTQALMTANTMKPQPGPQEILKGFFNAP